MKMLLALSLLLAGCTPDPASEPPVELLPGLYEVRVGGGTLVRLPSDERTARICFDPVDAMTFPKTPLFPTIGDWDSCTESPDEPRGNAISGKRQCDRKSPMTVAYSGSHSADSFDLRGTVTQGDDEGGGVMRLGSGDFSIEGKRIGDCTA